MQLSNSSLDVFDNCPRCFYLEKNLKVKRPRGIFPSLPGGIDRVMKNTTDIVRVQSQVLDHLDLPEKHFLYHGEKEIAKWRNWRSGLKYRFDEDGNVLIGALDDALVNSNGQFVPFDYKSRGSAGTQEGMEKYYQKQLDAYALLLGTTGASVADYGVILCVYPVECLQSTVKTTAKVGTFLFAAQTFVIQTDINRTKERLRKATECLESEILPPPGPSCEYCAYLAAASEYLKVPA